MKKMFLFICIVLTSACGLIDLLDPHENNSLIKYADDSALSDTLKQIYKDDAAWLTMMELTKKSSLNSDAFLPKDMIDDFYNSLVHVYNSQSAERDTVVDIYEIHTFSFMNLKRIYIGASFDYDWVQEWVKGNRLTGNSKIDVIMKKYNLTLGNVDTIMSHYSIVIESQQSLNTMQLASEFEGIPGIIYAEPGGAIGDGSTIEAVRNKTSFSLSYSLRWGDCPAGCINSRTWTFTVSKDGDVSFDGVHGRSLAGGYYLW